MRSAQSTRSKPLAAAALLGGTGYVFVPVEPLKLACLGLAAGALLGLLPGSFWRIPGLVAAALAFAAAFLLNPVGRAPFLPAAGLSPAAASVAGQALLLALGAAWLLAVRPRGPGMRTRWRPPGVTLVLLGLALLLPFHLAAWGMDVSYGGDEHYHIASALLAAALSRLLLADPATQVGLLVWLIAGLAVAGQTARPRAVRAAGADPLRRFAWWALAGLALAAVLPLRCYPDLQAECPDVYDRAVRYPAAPSWFSAFLCLSCFESWGRGWHFSFALLRLAPMIALFALGCWLAGDPRWRRQPFTLRLLAVLGIATLPTLLYHGTMLYLELPAVALLTVVLADGKRWLFASPAALRRRPGWWAGVLLGFAKDTAIVAVGLLWLARAAVQWKLARRRRPPRAGRLRAELAATAAVLGPGLLYLGLRSFHNPRPYALHLENLASLDAWSRAVASLGIQFGAALALAALGLVLLARRFGWARVLPGAAVFVGLGAFHFLEAPRWIGFPRLNLMLLPPVMVWAWEGLTWLASRHRIAGSLGCLLLLGANLLTSPLNLQGERAAWGGSEERWYPYTQCLADIRREAPRPVVLLGNMAEPYALAQVTDRLGWEPAFSISVPPPENTRGVPALLATLQYAASRSADYVIYRLDEPLPLPSEAAVAGYQRVRDYPARAGSLALFRRLAASR